eukprot:TRINITY_DN70585_c0_g1_i1.p1 TRINITY_DN70585_c0_g1~~TRINITY_DN70585_c0_g1_i1.p1  ORF type:complete len:396 (+),score=129.10 TRINITY_DN70585_c0_g1_i1:115-1302(+)
MAGEEEDRWGRRKVPTAEPPPPCRVDPVAAEAPAAADGGTARDEATRILLGMAGQDKSGGARYSSDYSRFLGPFAHHECDDSEEEEEKAPPQQFVPADQLVAQRPQNQPTYVTMPDGTKLIHVPPGGLPPGVQLPEGATEVKAEECPGTGPFLARAAEHFRAAEERCVKPLVERILRQVQQIADNRMSDARFRSFVGKYFEAYRLDPETLYGFHEIYSSKELKWWWNQNAWNDVVPVVIPELFDWWYRKYPTHNFEKIVDYFVACPQYPKFLAQCREQLREWIPKRPADAGGLKLEVLEQFGIGYDHMKLLRAWSLARMVDIWVSQFQAGMAGNRAGVGFASGLETLAQHSHKEVMKFKGWVEPPPGSVQSMLRTIVPSRQTDEHRNRKFQPGCI